MKAAPAMIFAIRIGIEGTGRERTFELINSVRWEAIQGPGMHAPILCGWRARMRKNPVSESDLPILYGSLVAFRPRVGLFLRCRSDASMRQVSRLSIS